MTGNDLARALERLQAAAGPESSSLDLSNLRLTDEQLAELRLLITELPGITSLDLNSNRLTDLPDWLQLHSGLTTLNLWDNRLATLPEWLGNLTGLVSLNIGNNRLQELPGWLDCLGCLAKLRVRGNQIRELRDGLACLTRLTHLDLGDNPLVGLPDWIGGLAGLTWLELARLGLAELPEWVADLSGLEILLVGRNKLARLPDGLARLLRLTHLDLSYNPLVGLPDWVGGLAGLTWLGLGGLGLAELPEWVADLSGLETLRVQSNELTRLPDGLARLTGLTYLDLGGNPLVGLPDWIGGLTALTRLDLARLGLAELPEWVADLSGLETLRVQSNELTRLPDGLARLTGLTHLDLGDNPLVEVPDWVGGLTGLTWLGLGGSGWLTVDLSGESLWIRSEGGLTRLPDGLARLTGLTYLDLSCNPLVGLPDWIGGLTALTRLDLARLGLAELPEWVADLSGLETLRVGHNKLTRLPDGLARLTGLTYLDLSYNPLVGLPDWIGGLTALTCLDLGGLGLAELPEWVADLSGLETLRVGYNKLTRLPDGLARLNRLTHLDVRGNSLVRLPAAISGLGRLEMLDVDANQLTEVPECLRELRSLRHLHISGNNIQELPPFLGGLPELWSLDVQDNPLAPEVLAAVEDGTDTLLEFLRLLLTDGERIHECKLILVGEGAAGKSSLLAALRGEPWVENRDTTHGVQIKQVQVEHDGQQITLNGWDFGGQAIYRPTHQLFFTNPAVYLVVWKPREGPERGQVEHWVRMIRHRAGEAARVHVVATHGGPGQRYAHLDEAALRVRFGDMIVGFHHVDSCSGQGLDDLRVAIGATAAGLPHTHRWYPRRWLALRAALDSEDTPYLEYGEYLRRAAAEGLDERSARSLAGNAHALGHWIHYADDPGLADLVILKPDWLSVAIGLVQEDGETIRNGGLLPHRRLAAIWNDPVRPAEHRYPNWQQRIFLRLMERFELSYQVNDGAGEPLSLVAQLVPADRPDYEEQWATAVPAEREAFQECRIIETRSDRAAIPEGLMFRLIVRFHRHSLGRENVADSVHWRDGLLLRDRYGARALITLDRNRVRITVRGAYPHGFLYALMQDVRDCIEEFWKGLATQVLVPCQVSCPRQAPGSGMFDLDKLYSRRHRGKPDFPCPVPDCDHDADIDELVHGIEQRTSSGPADPAGASAAAVNALLEQHTSQVLQAVAASRSAVVGRLDKLDRDTKIAFSRLEANLAALLRSLGDEAADGPRLFTVEPLGSTLRHPGLTSTQLRLTLWCEHSKLPIYLLDPDKPAAGQYTITVQRDWWTRAAPVLKAVSATVRCLLPVSISATELELNADQWAAVREQMTFARDGLDAMAQAATAVSDGDADQGIKAAPGGSTPVRAEGGLLRQFHAAVREQDIGWADLHRVQPTHGGYLWVHRQFVPIYHPPLPEIPAE